MAKSITALRGVDAPCPCMMQQGVGDDTAPPMDASKVALWVLSLGAVGYIFWATLQPPKRKRAA